MYPNTFFRNKRIIDDFDSPQLDENNYFYQSDSDTLGFSYDGSKNTKVVINLRQLKPQESKTFKCCKINLSSEFNELHLKSTNRLHFTNRKENKKSKNINKSKEINEDQSLSNDKTSNSSISKENKTLIKNYSNGIDCHIKVKRNHPEKCYSNLISDYCKPSKLELVKNIKSYRTEGLIGVKRRELLKILTSRAAI